MKALAAATAIALAALLPAVALAEGPEAGLVVDYGDGRVETYCVALGEAESVSGDELLELAGLEINELSGLLCSIEGSGCEHEGDFDSCTCECDWGSGEACIYWALFSRAADDDRWRYSPTSMYGLRAADGDLHGWSWGEGGPGWGEAPPPLTFAEVCAPPAAATEPPSAAEVTPAPSAVESQTPDAVAAGQPDSGREPEPAVAVDGGGGGDGGPDWRAIAIGSAVAVALLAAVAGVWRWRTARPGESAAALLIFAALNAVGLIAYFHPFVFAGATDPDSRWFTHATDGPIVFAAVAALCLALIVSNLGEGTLNSRSLAALGVLSALAAVLRAVTLPAGASLYFFLIIVGGYAFGPRLGFLLGVFSFFLGSVVTGGFGPWLPFQLFAAGWVGMSMGAVRLIAGGGGPDLRRDAILIVAGGVFWGFAYGFITNLWFWPFVVSGPDVAYQPGLGVVETVRRYWNFYLFTSLGWDLLRAGANAVVLILLARPLLRAMLRFHDRFSWRAEPFAPYRAAAPPDTVSSAPVVKLDASDAK